MCSVMFDRALTMRRAPLEVALLRRPSACHTARRTFLAPSRRQVRLTESIGHPRETVFAVVADVGRYSEFLPFCASSTVLTRHGADSFDARLSLGFKAFSEDYVSRVQVSHLQGAPARHAPL